MTEKVVPRSMPTTPGLGGSGLKTAAKVADSATARKDPSISMSALPIVLVRVREALNAARCAYKRTPGKGNRATGSFLL